MVLRKATKARTMAMSRNRISSVAAVYIPTKPMVRNASRSNAITLLIKPGPMINLTKASSLAKIIKPKLILMAMSGKDVSIETRYRDLLYI